MAAALRELAARRAGLLAEVAGILEGVVSISAMTHAGDTALPGGGFGLYRDPQDVQRGWRLGPVRHPAQQAEGAFTQFRTPEQGSADNRQGDGQLDDGHPHTDKRMDHPYGRRHRG